MNINPTRVTSASGAAAAPDVVNHPPHYSGFAHGAEVIDITEGLPTCRGTAIKYLARAGRKDPTKELEDLRKAEWYVKREIDRVRRTGLHTD